MALLRLMALSALGYAGYKYYEKSQGNKSAAYASGEDGSGFPHVRDAGPAAMADSPKRSWSATDEASDESFPASDPPATY